jgi:lysozyme family protein
LLLEGLVGSVLDVASLSNGVTLSSSDNLEHAATFAPVTSLLVTDNIGVNPGGSISGVQKSFSQVPGPVVGAGLPGLIAAAGALLALARRRRRHLVA